MAKKGTYILIIVVIIFAVALVVSRSRLRVKPTTEPERTPAPVEGAVPAEEGGTETVSPSAKTPEQSPEESAKIPAEETAEPPVQILYVPKEKLPEKLVEIRISKDGFEPKEFTVKQGDEFRLTFETADGDYIVRFAEPLQEIEMSVPQYGKRGVAIKAAKTGNFIFYCFEKGEKKAKAEGVIHVE